MPFLAVMGLSAATVLIAVLIAVSLVPAVLSLFGERLRPRARRPPPRPPRARPRRLGPGLGAHGHPQAPDRPAGGCDRPAHPRPARAQPAPRTAQLCLGPHGQYPAQELRPADEGLRPGLQRHTCRRRRDQGHTYQGRHGHRHGPAHVTGQGLRRGDRLPAGPQARQEPARHGRRTEDRAR
ncbi:MMPL family transporter [Streptomyces sp. NPDC059697]|uniref:MMPL family transporter n=1 Tax=Streptomyces sp. NPDC059697 TaxID=3346912 RepID=UPI003687A91A